MVDFLNAFFVSAPFIPHGHCYLWKPGLVGLHVVSDAAIALAYYSIPVTLFYFVRNRKDLPFNWIFLLFATFIVACGTTHIAEIWTLWHPTYWTSGIIKATTATVSLFTAIQLVPLVPQALALPSPAQLEQANRELQVQISERQRVEAELRHYQSQLEQRVQERTADLVAANEQLQREIRDRQTALEEQHRAEQALLQSEQRFRIAQELSLDAFTILRSVRDIAGQIVDFEWTYVNPKAAEIVQRSAESLVGQRLLQVFPSAKTQTNLFDCYVQVAETGEPLETETFYNGEGITGWFRNMVVKLEDGVAVSFSDISDRKQTEAEIATLNRDLQNRIDELQTLFEVIPIGILMSQDSEFKQVKSNPAFSQILGIPVDANVSYTPPDRSHPAYKIFRNGRELTVDEFPLRHAAIHRVELKGDEVDILRQDGAIFNLYGYAAPLLDEQGNARGAVAAFLDITDRKQAEAEREYLLAREQAAREQAEAANRIKDEFLAVLSHELRTPLNPILGWTTLLRTGKLDEQKAALALETIERNARLQTQLIEDLLDVSRILRGKLTLNVHPVDLVAIVEAAKETVQLAAEAKSIQVRLTALDVELGEGRVSPDQFHPKLNSTQTPTFQVLGDSSRLQQVVWNLLSNAVKFTPAGGEIQVTLSTVGAYAQLQVTDTGRGIVPEFLPYVFDTFRQADSTTTRKFGGLGLGLAIVRHLVELHGGTVRATSSGENTGATFTVRLPLLKQEGGRMKDDPSNLSLISHPSSLIPHSSFLPLQSLKTLIIDDDADMRELAAFVLTQHGARVAVAASAAEALAQLRQSVPDILLCDIGMPEMDGYMLIRQVRSWPPEQGGTVPAIALTAYAGEFNRLRALAAGFQQHLSKPVDPQALVRAIVQLTRPIQTI